MPTNHIGNPNETLAPSGAPGPGIYPTVVIPLDGEPGAAASVTQGVEVCSDFIAYLMDPHNRSVEQENFVFTSVAYTANQTPIPNAPKVQAKVSGTGATVTIGDGNAAILPGSTAAGFSYIGSYGSLVVGSNGVLIVEFDYTTSGNSNNIEHRLGTGDANVQLHSATNYAILQSAVNTNVWTLNVNGTTVPSVGTYVIGTKQKIIIAQYSATSAVGIANGSAITKAYINGTLVGSINAIAFNSSVQYVAAGAKGSGGAPTGNGSNVPCYTYQWTR